MKRVFITGALMLMCTTAFISCRETNEKETIVRETEVEKEPEEEVESEGLLERTGEKVDEEVNKEIDEEIEKIGDDN